MLSTWFIWNKISIRRLLKKYKPENDKGRKGNEPIITEFGAVKTAERGTEEPIIDNDRLGKSERRELLQETDANNDGKNNISNRKVKFIRRK